MRHADADATCGCFKRHAPLCERPSKMLYVPLITYVAIDTFCFILAIVWLFANLTSPNKGALKTRALHYINIVNDFVQV